MAAVRLDKAKFDVFSADSGSTIHTVIGAGKPGAGGAIVVNGTYFYVSSIGNTLKTQGRVISNYGVLSAISSDTTDTHPEAKTWIGIKGGGVNPWAHGTPSGNSTMDNPPVAGNPSAPLATDLRAAVGGVIQLLPPYASVQNAMSAFQNVQHPYDYNTKPSSMIGWDSNDKVLFIVVTKDCSDAIACNFGTFVNKLALSGANVLYTLDGGGSTGMANCNRTGNNLAVVGNPSGRHNSSFSALGRYVNNYIVISLTP